MSPAQPLRAETRHRAAVPGAAPDCEHLRELMLREGLGQEVVHARREALLAIFVGGGRRERDHRHPRQAQGLFLAADLARGCQAVQPRHVPLYRRAERACGLNRDGQVRPAAAVYKIVWLTANDQKFAQLTLNPPQMGPIEISLNINKDTASAYFISPNAEVREAIETALPRLREMLAGVGIELGQPR